MKIILKHTLKSMMAHKLRTLMLVFCIFGCSLAALLSLDMSGSLEDVLRAALANVAGSTDILFSTDVPVDEDFMDGAPENTTVPIIAVQNEFVREIPDMYGYVHKDYVSVMSMDIAKGRELGIVPSDMTLASGEVAISAGFAKDYGYEVGDTITLHDKNKQPVDFTVKSIQNARGAFVSGSFVISLEDIGMLYGDTEPEINRAFIDIKDNGRITEAAELLESRFPSADVQNLFESEDMQESIASVTRIFYILFVVCLLLVIFVTVSVSERLIVEKMSVVGTMRSLGISSGMTAFILLFENIIYGLVGGILGCVAYSGFRQALFGSMITVTNGSGEQMAFDTGATKFYVYVIVVLGAILLQCVCPTKEIVKAIRTPIRDIIFDNKDSQYRTSKFGTVCGIICAVTAVISAFFSDTFSGNLICFIAIAGAAAFLFPCLLRFLAGLLEKLFVKLRMPIARLATAEVHSKKSTVGSSVLCVTAASLSIVIFMFSGALKENLLFPYFSSDVIVSTDSYTDKTMYSYTEDLPDTESVEYFYSGVDNYLLCGESIIGCVYGWKDGGYQMFDGLVSIPDSIGYEEVVLDTHLMEKYGYAVGDTVEIEFKHGMFMPVTKMLTVSGVCENDYFMSSGTAVIISEKLYTDIFHEYPSYVLIGSSNPEETAKAVRKYSSGLALSVQTYDEFMQELVINSTGITSVLNALIILGIGLTFFGMLSNQLIGFESRKRECAVLTSAVMAKGQLAKMFLLESFFAALLSVAAAVPISVLMVNKFMALTKYLELYLVLDGSAGAYIAFAVVLIAVFTLTALFPIRAMRRMDTVTQLKYE